MPQSTFATAINCMDGRTQEPVITWMKQQFGVDYVDAITEPGAAKVLVDGSPEQIESVKKRVLISVNNHGSRHIAIVSHHDCAGNPAPDDVKKEMNRQAIEIVKSWGLPVRVIGVWVDDTWKVNVIADTHSS